MRWAWILCAVVAFGGGGRQTGTARAVPVLVELFTAEGCSSCPPADVLLEKMLAQQPAAGATLVGMGEHVDYWNRSGWNDRFSSAGFTKRQGQYAARSGGSEVYTPQMVVDGGEGFVGTDVAAARQAIEHAVASPHGEISIELEPQADRNMITVVIGIRALPTLADNDSADVLVAVTEDGLHTDVKGGENRGRTLTHAAVVRDLVMVGPAGTEDASMRTWVRLHKEWRRDALKILAFVQQRRSRHILATAVRPVEK
jgi:hypothetical protein